MPYITTDSDQTAIYGTGDTPEASWQDTLSSLGYTEADVIPEDAETPDMDGIAGCWSVDLRRSHFHTMPATPELITLVQDRGGNITWDVVDGVACVPAD